MAKFVATNIKVTTENKCDLCTNSKCCTYLTQEIDTPRSKQDFEHILWQVSHQNIQAYKDEDGWYLLINNPCTHLLDDGRCGIYDTRPLVCRDHTNDYCEYDAPAEDSFDLFFDGYKSLLKYCKKRYKRWGK
ncbi:MAG: YkgJ family cysteine cluster protein [Gammaproteobacteria bacterium]|nr:YkgJ family cysteine cluster protein [Gammaproteobacteria bacterium]